MKQKIEYFEKWTNEVSTEQIKSIAMLLKHIYETIYKNENPEQLSHAYIGLTTIFDRMGMVDSAYLYLKLYNELTNSTIEKTKTISTYRGYVATVLESAKKELTISGQNLQLKNRRFIITVVSEIGIFIILFLIVVQQKRRIINVEDKDLVMRLAYEKKLKQLQEEQYKETLDLKIREVTSYSLLLSNKNNVLQQIEEITKRLPEHQKEVEAINHIIKNNQNIDHDWDHFMLHFKKVHSDFFNKLKALNNDFSQNDLRLCPYIRIGMESKRIAQI